VRELRRQFAQGPERGVQSRQHRVEGDHEGLDFRRRVAGPQPLIERARVDARHPVAQLGERLQAAPRDAVAYEQREQQRRRQHHRQLLAVAAEHGSVSRPVEQRLDPRAARPGESLRGDEPAAASGRAPAVHLDLVLAAEVARRGRQHRRVDRRRRPALVV
jgi:hypothetical protein